MGDPEMATRCVARYASVDETEAVHKLRSATPGERTWAASLDLHTVGLTDFAAALDVLDSLD